MPRRAVSRILIYALAIVTIVFGAAAALVVSWRRPE